MTVVGFFCFVLAMGASYLVFRLLFGPKPRIKCNVSSSGKKIYHIPGDSLYECTRIKEDKGEFYAWTETEAMEKGFTRSSVK